MRFQTMLEGAECLRRSDSGWQSVPGALKLLVNPYFIDLQGDYVMKQIYQGYY